MISTCAPGMRPGELDRRTSRTANACRQTSRLPCGKAHRQAGSQFTGRNRSGQVGSQEGIQAR